MCMYSVSMFCITAVSVCVVSGAVAALHSTKQTMNSSEHLLGMPCRADRNKHLGVVPAGLREGVQQRDTLILAKKAVQDYDMAVSQPQAVWRGATGHLAIPN